MYIKIILIILKYIQIKETLPCSVLRALISAMFYINSFIDRSGIRFYKFTKQLFEVATHTMSTKFGKQYIHLEYYLLIHFYKFCEWQYRISNDDTFMEIHFTVIGNLVHKSVFLLSFESSRFKQFFILNKKKDCNELTYLIN